MTKLKCNDIEVFISAVRSTWIRHTQLH